ncbi:MAG: hypothetical protein Ta2D_13500 [Rickettsiales bacterium]|nr:MAG: hypothetical protein Ta2D_13500 [Rickettsiales bacterium]
MILLLVFFTNVGEPYISVITYQEARCEKNKTIFEKINDVDNERKRRGGENEKYNVPEQCKLIDLMGDLGNEVKKYNKTSAEILYSFVNNRGEHLGKKSILEMFNKVPNRSAGWKNPSSAKIISLALKEEYPDINIIQSFNSNRNPTLSEVWSNVVERSIPDEKSNWNDKKKYSTIISK